MMPGPLVLLGALILRFLAGTGEVRAPADAPDPLEAILADERTPVLLMFFATDCPVCFDDLLDMAYFIDREGLPVRAVGVSGDAEADLREFVGKYSVRIPVIRDQRGRIRKRFKVDGFPFRIVLRGKEVVFRDDPYLPLDERREAARRFLAGGCFR